MRLTRHLGDAVGEEVARDFGKYFSFFGKVAFVKGSRRVLYRVEYNDGDQWIITLRHHGQCKLLERERRWRTWNCTS